MNGVRFGAFLLLVGGSIAAMAYTKKNVDEVYTMGPEVTTAHAKAIVAGQISDHAKQTLSTSEPSGPDALPFKWTVTGRVLNPTVLKGTHIGPVSFARMEASTLITDTLNEPSWVRTYGEVRPAGRVVLFFEDDPASAVLTVPSESGETDLVSLVRDLVAIQGLPADGQLSAWLAYIESSKTDSGRRAALRSIVRMDADWKKTQPVLDRMFADRLVDERMRTFTFGIVVFGLSKNGWGPDQTSVASFLGRQLEQAPSTDAALQYVLQMKVALMFTMQEASRAARTAARERLVMALRNNEKKLSVSPEIAEQYRQIRESYPGLI